MDPLAGSLFFVANVVIAWAYCWRIGRSVLKNHTNGHRRIWGSFIYACGAGHLVMVGHMVIWQEPWSLWAVIVTDLVTAVVSVEAAIKQPDLPV
jgi:hypothetical protein